METVYVDDLFILNLVIDYFLLLGTAKICALPLHRKRFAAAAAVGGLWCCLSLYPPTSFLGLPLLYPVLAMLMTLIAFGGERRIFRCLLAFLGVSALFGGSVYAAGLCRGTVPGSGRLIRLDMRVLVLSFALCWAAVSLVFRRSIHNTRHRIRELTVEKNGRTVRFRALEDTGNGLYDPLSGCAAFVAEESVLKGLFSPAEADILHAAPEEALRRISGARLIPYSGIGGSRGLLLAFRPDRVTVDGVETPDLLAAVSAAPIGTDGSYQAVI